MAIETISNNMLETPSLKAACRLATTDTLTATTGNGTWVLTAQVHTAGSVGTSTIDGFVLADGDRILVKNETGGNDGVFVVSGDGAGVLTVLTRTDDFNTSALIVSGSMFAVQEGTANEDTLWMMATDAAITVGTTALNFIQIGNVTTAGNASTAQLAYFDTSSDVINGSSALTWNGSKLTVSNATAENFSINDTGGSTAAATDVRMTWDGGGTVRGRLRYSSGIFRWENLEGPIEISPALSSGLEVVEILKGGLVFNERADHGLTPVAAHGEIWLRNDANQSLIFTDDAGTDFDLTDTGGNVSNTGTPVNDQLAVWTDATTIEGSANLTYTATAFTAGNYTFNTDQTVAAGQDNYVLVYDNGSGEIQLENVLFVAVGGSNSQMQYNNGNSLDGASPFTYDDAAAGSGGQAFTINSLTTTANGLNIFGDQQTSGVTLNVSANNATKTGVVANFLQDNATSTAAVIQVTQDGTGDMLTMFDGVTEAFTINQVGKIDRYGGAATTTNRQALISDGTDIELRLLVEADISDLQTYQTGSGTADRLAFWSGTNVLTDSANLLYDTNATTGDQLQILANTGLTSGSVLEVLGNVSTVTGPIVRIDQDHASSTARALEIKCDGTGDALYVEAFLAAGTAARFYSNIATRTQPVVEIVNDHATGAGNALYVQNDSATGLAIDVVGDVDISGDVTVGGATVYTIATLANDATPSVLGARTFLTGGTTTITDFDDGVTGQEIVIMAEHTITITDGTNIFLNGSANFAMTDSDTLTLIQKVDTFWYEIARSDSGA